MRDYELVFIVQPEVDEEGLAAVVDRVNQLIGGNGGQVTQVDSWGKRRLAYPIRKCREGYYVVMQVQLEPEATKELERNLGLTEGIIRHLLVRVGE